MKKLVILLLFVLSVFSFSKVNKSMKSKAKQPTKNERVLVVNTMTVNENANPETVVNLQLELVEKLKKNWKGFVSQQTLISTDNKTVTTIEIYESMESLENIVKEKVLLEYRQKISELAKMAPIVYKIKGSTVSAK